MITHHKVKFLGLPTLMFILHAPSVVLSQDSMSAYGAPDVQTPAILSPAAQIALPADRIIELLRDKPELLIELKKVAAERLSTNGIEVQEDSISDELLFEKIVSDSGLRSSLTLWLRARGYVSDVDIQQSKAIPPKLDEDYTPQDYYRQMPPIRTAVPAAGHELSGATPPNPSEDQPEELRSSYVPIPAPGRTSPTRVPNNVSSSSERDPNTASSQQVLHRTAPYNLLSMRDLYSQVPDRNSSLRRFGSDAFLSRGMDSQKTVFDLPVGPDYVLGPGDTISIDLWGGVSQRFSRTVDHEGRVSLPEAGPVVVAGLALERAQKLIEDALLSQFRNVKVEVSIARLRTVRIYVVGDVQRPGAYDVSSLSTPLNALYAAGGPTAVGSLRTVRHLRGKQLIAEVDLYDFLLHGVRSDGERLQAGDTILVPPAGVQVTVSGMVRRPAIYELRNETKLSEVLDLAGGLLVAAATREIKVERIEEHEHRISLSVSYPEGGTAEALAKAIQSFVVVDGDHISVAPILPYSERSVYVEGHVIRPGKFAYRDDMSLNDVIHSYQDLLPEPSDHAEIVRLRPPDYRPETLEFSLSEVLIGDDPIHLQPFDTIRIFGRYEVDAPRVTIQGEVLRPGQYPLPEGMTAAQLVRMAGGFTRAALLENADLTSYVIVHGEKVVSHRTSIDIGRAVKAKDSAADARLKPGDVLTIHQLSGWSDIGASVTLKGEVTYPGAYGIQDGERLSSVLKRAGGFRPGAYPAGAVLLRNQVRELEEKSREELIHQLETTSAGAKLSPAANGGEQIGTLQFIMAQQKQVVQQLKSLAPTGRLVIKISTDISSWENTPVDIELRSGDVLSIPKRPSFVLVTGQVYNSAALTFVPGKSAGWYLSRAGGPTNMANKKEIFVIRANGSVVGRDSGGWYSNNVLETKMQPGDVVVVPQKIIGGNNTWRNLLATAQLMSNIAITAHVAGF
ncbi:MAG TPA: SLBB domain-containing protein [Candidatus Binatia bacterium]|nr:SLBB domain-containing protein [Candidatus Binatia bacterium]